MRSSRMSMRHTQSRGSDRSIGADVHMRLLMWHGWVSPNLIQHASVRWVGGPYQATRPTPYLISMVSIYHTASHMSRPVLSSFDDITGLSTICNRNHPHGPCIHAWWHPCYPPPQRRNERSTPIPYMDGVGLPRSTRWRGSIAFDHEMFDCCLF